LVINIQIKPGEPTAINIKRKTVILRNNYEMCITFVYPTIDFKKIQMWKTM